MIRESTLNAVYPLAEKLGNNGQMVCSVGASPLSALGASLQLPMNESTYSPDLITRLSSIDQAGETQPHSADMDEMLSIATKAIRAQLNLAQSVVKPAVVDMLSKVEARVSEQFESEGRFTIQQWKLPEVYSLTTLRDLVGKFERTPQNNNYSEPLSKILPSLELEELQKLVKCGVKRIDEKVEDTLLADANILTAVYNLLFRRDYMAPVSVDAAEQAEVMDVLAFFMARSLLENVPSGVTADLASYRAYMGTAVAEFGRRVLKHLERDERNLRQKRIVLVQASPTSFDKTIKVHKGLFDRFIKEGGDVDSILGAAIRGISAPSYVDLLEDAYGGVAAMRNNERMLNVRNKARKATFITQALSDEMNAAIKAQNVEENPNVAHRADFAEWLEANPYHSHMEVRLWVMSAVCNVLYPHVNAESILLGIQGYLEEDEKLAPREAATLVAFDIIADWLVEMMVVEKAV